MGETDLHRRVMIETIDALIDYFAGQQVYVTGDLLLFYEQGNRRKHVSPDAMIVRGAEMRPRDYYLLWEEGRTPNAVVEITSKSTRREDMQTKLRLYRDVLHIPEYFLFDPTSDYLKPRLQGFRLAQGQYIPIEPVEGRLPSVELGLELEADGTSLRLRNPTTGQWLLNRAEARDLADAAREQADAARHQADAARQQADAAHQQMAAENAALQRENAELRRKLGNEAQ
ncbi:MAG: Uma2 family endonuclease [Pirellulaceae bacterium]